MGNRGPKTGAAKAAERTAKKAWKGIPPWEKPGLTRAEAVIAFIEVLPITAGKLAGSKLKVRPWQRNIIEGIYKEVDGKRIVRTALLTMPRKNGKTTLAAALALAHLVGPESEQRGQVYSAAADREQSSIIFREMESFILNIPEFAERCNIRFFYKEITDEITGSVYRAMASDCRKAHGLSPSFMIYDELAQSRGRELYDNLVTGTGAREEPLMVVISTQSPDPYHIMSELVDYGQGINDGVLPPDATVYSAIFQAPDESDPWDEKTWFDCNPALDDFRSLEEMREFANQAQRIPIRENVFRNLYLNQRVDASSCFINSSDFQACVGDIPDLTGRPCYGGLDLSSTTDLSAFVLVFPPEDDKPFYVLPFSWVPGDSIKERSQTDRVPYQQWSKQGYIESMPGSVLEYGPILQKIDELAQKYDILGICFDRWGAHLIRQNLQDAGMEVIQFGQGYKSMSPPTKELLKLILEKKILFPDNPVLKWSASNIVVEQDSAGNIKPSKKRSNEKIDPMVALIMGLDAAIRNSMEPVQPKIMWM